MKKKVEWEKRNYSNLSVNQASEYIVFSHMRVTVLAVLLFEYNSEKVANHIDL